MKSPEVVDDLIEFYHHSAREDIKVETVKALSNYQSHHIDLFLLEILESIVADDAFRTEEKRELFHVIANKIANIAIPTVLKILKVNSENFRIIANSILVLGELAVKTKDETLFYLLSKYLAPIYSRRIRANSTLYLYQHKDFRKYANACISSLLTSGNEYDRNAVAYIAGELKLESLTPFILEASSKIQHQSSTLLIALLKLGYSTAHQILADRIVHDDRNAVVDILKQINMIKDTSSRHAIYYHIFAKYPSKVDHLLEMMSLSEKNFDRDRIALRKEAMKLGIYIKHDTKLFLAKGQLRSVA
jgi:HEAT repeat protein